MAYSFDGSASHLLHQRASAVMPGGNTRHSIARFPYPAYAVRGLGCEVIDADGEKRIDFLNNFTSLILGHADPIVTTAVEQRIRQGTAFAMPTEVEVELAELLVDRVPSIDQIRFCNSGSEAMMMAIKAARAWTGRSKIAKFEGAFHGTYDYALVSDSPGPDSWGEPEAPSSVLDGGSAPSIAQEVVVMPWNNLGVCRRLIAKHGADLAAVIVDVLPTNLGLIPPREGFLELLREETDRHGVLLISDEVLSFRLSYHGAIARHRLLADLVCFGKIIGGGFPVGAVGGSAKVMSIFDHTATAKVQHSGTFNANPVTMTAGLATLRQMTPDAYGRLERMGDDLRERLRRLLRDRNTPGQVLGAGSLFSVQFLEHELTDFRSLDPATQRYKAQKVSLEMLANGIIISPKAVFGCLSTPMTSAELQAFVEAFDRSI
jgi:glutamate-1-semialdehyde 2,1-aminomutase